MKPATSALIQALHKRHDEIKEIVVSPAFLKQLQDEWEGQLVKDAIPKANYFRGVPVRIGLPDFEVR